MQSFWYHQQKKDLLILKTFQFSKEIQLRNREWLRFASLDNAQQESSHEIQLRWSLEIDFSCKSQLAFRFDQGCVSRGKYFSRTFCIVSCTYSMCVVNVVGVVTYMWCSRPNFSHILILICALVIRVDTPHFTQCFTYCLAVQTLV